MTLKGSDKLREGKHSCTVCDMHGEGESPGEALTREGSFLPLRALLWWRPLGETLKDQPRLESGRTDKHKERVWALPSDFHSVHVMSR